MCMFVAEQTPEVAFGPLDAAREALAEDMTAHAWQQDMEIDRDSKFKPFISGCTPAPTALGSQDLTSDSKKKIRVYGKERKVDRSSVSLEPSFSCLCISSTRSLFTLFSAYLNPCTEEKTPSYRPQGQHLPRPNEHSP